ncbi:MAG TPA: helix-hairpin-helix domain-containing protein [Intrasporangium sp.]|uniref:ComEA family DNA-binding protein n=1 Tax=Intrasporangium sp. TaxID=1925024 RepID=UPI002D782324|nr:helix-hairpin-helix domain-containing protein [Intrasporangium sp.]HET7397981.1 helix-hairpin-helix domain-containing protein [Intrasporangium sp.]
MPFRRASRPPDLGRVAGVLRGPEVRSGWVPAEPRPPEGPAPGRRAPAPGASRRRAVAPDAGDVSDELARLDAELRRARRPALLTLPEQLRAGRVAVSTPAVVAMLALVVALACAFVLRVLWAERAAGDGPPVAPATAGPRVESRGDPGSGGGTSASSPSDTPASPAPRAAGRPPRSGPAPPDGEVVVHVVGQVMRPGLVRLRPGARVADALAAAGGTAPGADLAALNLARVVVDGEQVMVPRPGQPPLAPPGTAADTGRGASGGTGTGGTGAAARDAPVSLNTADLAALDGLPGVGPVLAQRILDWRAEHGRFTSVDELGEVSGIGEKLLAQLKARVTL